MRRAAAAEADPQDAVNPTHHHPQWGATRNYKLRVALVMAATSPTKKRARITLEAVDETSAVLNLGGFGLTSEKVRRIVDAGRGLGIELRVVGNALTAGAD